VPVNSYEAESRRLARFVPEGHSSGEMRPAFDRSRFPEFRYTVDLRLADKAKPAQA
jgi:uncharacterized protein (DUF2126 family)